MMQIHVTGGSISPEEEAAYVQYICQKYPGGSVQTLDIHVDGAFVDLTYHFVPKPFERIRRITGYLVGDMTRWNNAKTAEEHDRVKHG